MIENVQFVKEIPATEDSIYQLINVPSGGFATIIENLDAASSLTYKFQQSADGVTWTDILFNVSNCTSQESTFTLAAGNHHLIKVLPTQARVRFRAYGTLDANIGIMYRKASAFLASSGAVEIIA